jgi:hypothetical protein
MGGLAGLIHDHSLTADRVSSIPSRLVGGGSGSHFVAATTSALCAVRQDTRYSTATSETARLPDAIAIASRCRSRSVIRARGGTAAETWVNDLRAHSASPQIRPELYRWW